MINYKLLKVNEPNIVHETIDEEAILLDLISGNYYSLDGVGAVLWDYISATGDWKSAVDILKTNCTIDKNEVDRILNKFVQDLIEEKLLIEAKQEVIIDEVLKESLEADLLKSSEDFKEPVLNKYTDMKDLLLLDPIHDVDEKGWPEAPDNIDESTEK